MTQLVTEKESATSAADVIILRRHPDELRAPAMSMPDCTRLTRTRPDTAGWYADVQGDDAYTIANVRLDVVPVKVVQPLYKPLQTPQP